MQRPAEGLFASDFADELDLGGRQIDVRRQKVEVLDARTHQHILDRRVRRDQQVVDGLVELVMRHAETRGQRTLRIEVDKQYASPVLGERGTQVDRRRRLADAALLIAHGDDGRRSVSVEGRRRRNVAVGTPGGADLVVGMIALVDVDAGRHMKAVLIVGMTSRPRCTRCAHVPAFLTDHVSTPLVSLMVHCTEAVEHRRTGLPRRSARSRMGRGVHLTHRVDRDEGVDLRRRHRGVPEQLLDHSHIGAAIEEVRRE